MKLYVIKMPGEPGLHVVRAMRIALEALGTIPATYVQARHTIERVEATTGPYLLGESDDAEAIKTARLALAEAGVTCAQDLPEQALEPPAPEPEPEAPQPISYNAARIALVAMQLANGDPFMALHNCVLLANAAGEVEGEPGTCMQAASVLLDVFPPTLIDTIKATIKHYTGIEPKEDPNG